MWRVSSGELEACGDCEGKLSECTDMRLSAPCALEGLVPGDKSKG